jgi:hypothetical protein
VDAQTFVTTLRSKLESALAALDVARPACLTPLLWAHVNPYGTFTLDMSEQLPLE